MALRTSLDPSLNHESIELAGEAVNSHLRLLVVVDQKSGLIVISTTSEPIVADVTANHRKLPVVGRSRPDNRTDLCPRGNAD
jgi:hypothetical protein